MPHTILVTGATGNVGKATIEALLETGATIRAGVRKPSAVREEMPHGVEVVRFDFQDEATFPAALHDVNRLLLVRPPAISDANVFKRLLKAAQTAGVGQIVFLSVQGAENARFIPHAKIEDALTESGMSHTLLRAGFFMQNLSQQHREEIRRRNEIFIPVGDALTAFIDARDIGAVAAKCLTESGHHNKIYTLTGAQAFTYGEVAQVLSEELGRKITYKNPSLRQYIWQRWRGGDPLMYVLVTAFLYLSTRRGQAEQVHPDTRELLGREPISLRQFVRDHISVWQP